MAKLAAFLILFLVPCGAQTVTIKHLVFIVKENRSFDSYFGQFPGVAAVCTGGTNAGTACIAPNDAESQCTGGGTCPQITVAKCFNASKPIGGCTAAANSQSTVPMLAGNPNIGDTDCSHDHIDFIGDWHLGAMDKFNQNCSNSTSWAVQYNAASIPNYWAYAQSYGLADHMRASAMAPSQPSHMIIFAGTTGETRDNNSGVIAGGSCYAGSRQNLYCTSNSQCPNGTGTSTCIGQTWSLNAYHYGRCNGNGGASYANALCQSNSDCGTATCLIDSPTGKCCSQGQACDFTEGIGATCTKNSDCSSTQFCSNGNTYGENGQTFQSNWAAIDLTGSAGASGTNTGRGMWPGTCSSSSGSTVLPPIACVRVCPPASLPAECSATSSMDDTACTRRGYTCNAGHAAVPPALLAGSRGNIGMNVTTVGDLLTTNGVSWAMYIPSSEELRNPAAYVLHHRYGTDWTTKVFPDTQFDTDAASCTSDTTCNLPNVLWLETTTGNEHPPFLVSTGEAWTVDKVNAVASNSYLWSNTLIFIFWDDFGGFYDHMAPTVDGEDWRNGFRVPAICVGKYCKNEVIHTEFTFESALAMIENMFANGTRLPGSLYDSTANDLGTGCVAGPTCTGHNGSGMVDLTLTNPPLVQVKPEGSTTADSRSK